MCLLVPEAGRKSTQLTEHTGPVTQYPPLLRAVGGGRLLQGLVKLAGRRQQDRDPLDLHGRNTWEPGREGPGVAADTAVREGCQVLPPQGPSDTAHRSRSGSGEGPATSLATFHVHLGGLHNFLVDHKLRELFEKDGTGVDEDRVIKERGLQRDGE